MNVLIIYPFYNQRELMHNFASRLTEKGVHTDVINISQYRFEKFSEVKWPKSFLKLVNFANNSKWSFGVKFLKRLLSNVYLQKLFPLYDVIDFHAYYPSYNKWMKSCIDNNVKFDITLWGSDLMRATEERKQQLRFGFDHCYKIKLTGNLHDVLKEYYGALYDDKCRLVYFGNSGLDDIESLDHQKVDEGKKKLYGDTGNKKIVVCGYNSIPSQNHMKMVEALSKLSPEERNAVHAVFPMTYGARPGYIDDVRSELDKKGVSYTILDHFLDPAEVAVIRKTADIVINVQDTDALSGSLQSHLYCGNVCIFGEWLNYSPFINNGVYYIKTSMDGIAEHLKDVLRDFSKYKTLSAGNHDIIGRLFTWEATIGKQTAVYGE